jgi:catechol 2,3-dioxygenase-like lactoylglutathione lyase family enzyme
MSAKVKAAQVEAESAEGQPEQEEGKTRTRRGKREVELEGLKQLALVWVWVKDLRAAVAFYKEQVGLKLSYLDEATGWAFFATGVEGLDLGLQVWPFGGAVPRGGGACPVFEVVNLAEARQALESRGVVFEGMAEGGEGQRRHATFHDPDGNPVTLTQNW